MMKIQTGDITKLREVDIIVNAANGIGVMGAGVAGAISRSAGDLWSSNLRQYCKDNGPFEPGNCYSNGDAGLLKRRDIQEVYHAVTMKYPGGPTKMEYVIDSVHQCIKRAISEGKKSIAFPGLGTGIGGLDKEAVAHRMATELMNYTDKIDILIIDRNQDFINHFKKATGQDDKIEGNENHENITDTSYKRDNSAISET